MSKTLFQRIIDREIPAKIEYEDDRAIVIRDISPVAPTHLLVIPKTPIPRVSAATDSDEPTLGHLVVVAGKVAEELGLGTGFRLVINSGPDAGETVPHVHVHLLAGRPLSWPPG